MGGCGLQEPAYRLTVHVRRLRKDAYYYFNGTARLRPKALPVRGRE
jgi:hypothetical protein